MDKQRGIGNATFAASRRSAMRRLACSHESSHERTTTRHAVIAGILLGLILAAPTGHLAWAEAPCPIPDDLALRDISLPAAKQQVAADRHLVVLTFGGVLPAGADAETLGATYPARLAAALSAALPEIKVTVVNEAPPGKTSVGVPVTLPRLIAKSGVKLVIWGPGGRDVAAELDIVAFRNAVNAGIEAVRHGGADLILLDTTFVPSPARMVAIEAYRESLLSAAAANRVPLLRRHAMMRLWSEDGTLNLAAREPAERELVARRLFSCVAQGLAAPIAAAVR